MNNKTIPIAIIIAGVLVAGIIFYTNYSKNSEGEVISADQAAEKVINFINEVVLAGETTASLAEVLEENGLYKIRFDVDGQEADWMITKDGKLIFPQTINLDDFIEDENAETEEEKTTIGNFFQTNDSIITENGKPIIYFFGSESCLHCRWERPIMKQVAVKFDGYISFHDNMDTDADEDVFIKYSAEGYIPATIIGGVYYRVGSGENLGEKENADTLTALICKLTNNQPADVCNEVQELINNI